MASTSAVQASDGLTLHVGVDGSDDAPTVVLVHGFAASSDIQWRASGMVRRLVDADLRVVTFDLRGHGHSEAPTDPSSYGDSRMAGDVREVVERMGGDGAVVAGYSMGAALTLLALEAGLVARGAVVGAAPPAVLRWTPADQAMAGAAIAALRGESADPSMAPWLAMLDETGTNPLAMAAVLEGHQPVVKHWDRITPSCVFVAGDRDLMAAPPAELAAHVAGSRAVTIPGDHFTAAASPELANAIIEAVRSL